LAVRTGEPEGEVDPFLLGNGVEEGIGGQLDPIGVDASSGQAPLSPFLGDEEQLGLDRSRRGRGRHRHGRAGLLRSTRKIYDSGDKYHRHAKQRALRRVRHPLFPPEEQTRSQPGPEPGKRLTSKPDQTRRTTEKNFCD
jgi:hypothetical protein